MYKVICDVMFGVESFGFNVLIVKFYGFINILVKFKVGVDVKKEVVKILVKLMVFMILYFVEDMWQFLGGDGFVIYVLWFIVDEVMLVEVNVMFLIQINGKCCVEIFVFKDMLKEEVEKIVLVQEVVVKVLDGVQFKKLIVVSGWIVNVVI